MEDIRKKIWLVNFYAMPPKLETRLRTIKFAHFLTLSGYDVTVFGSSTMHNRNIDLIEGKSKYIKRSYGDLNFVHVKSISYKTNGVRRILSMLLFHYRLHYLRNKFSPPDIILHSAWPPFGNITYLTARRLGAKYIVEVQDLWPESFVTFGLVRRGNILLWFSYLAEKWLYKKANKIVFTMEGAKDYIIEKKWNSENGGPIDMNKIHYINNGVDLKDFDYNKENYVIKDDDLEDEKNFKVIYLGSIGLANNIKRLIDAAICLQSHEQIKFLIYGDGDERAMLEEYLILNKVKNVLFKQKWIDPEYVPYVLSKSSLNLLNYLPNDIVKYGGSQSKFFQYLASGKPICSNIEMAYCQIRKFNLGIAKFFNTPQEYADAILSVYNLDTVSYNEMCSRARTLAREFDYKFLTSKMVELL